MALVIQSMEVPLNNQNLSKLRVTFAGLLFYWVLPIRRQIVLKNIELVFKNTASSKEKTRLAKAFYSHVASVFKEMFLMSWISPVTMHKKIEIQGLEHLDLAMKKNKGILLMSGHLGNWELLFGLGFSSLIPHFGKINIIRRSIRMKWLERVLFNRFKRHGLTIINSVDAPRRINQALKNKELVFFAMDQHVQLKNKAGIAVDFFNVKAGTYRSLALFAQKYNSPIVPVSGYRRNDGIHVLKFHPEIEWDTQAGKEDAIYQATLACNQALEKFILEHPEQWWWVHRRWKL